MVKIEISIDFEDPKTKKWLKISGLVILIIVILSVIIFVIYLICKSDRQFNEWEIEILREHNEYRALHGVLPLVLNITLSEISQKWADDLLKTNHWDHNYAVIKPLKLGENLYTQWTNEDIPLNPTKVNSSAATSGWYREIDDWDFDLGDRKLTSKNKMIGHFTQLVWKSTTDVGCAFSIGKISKDLTRTVICCNYYPGGNYPSLYKSQVPRPLKSH